MFFHNRVEQPNPTQRLFHNGFTLLELLLVIALLGIVASLAVAGYEDVQDQARYDAARYEMAEIRKALLRFRRDTGELPCRVYRSGNYQPNDTTMTSLDFTGLADTELADYFHWCENRASNQQDNALSMLQTFPYSRLAHPALLWDADTHRGWNGPYLPGTSLNDPWGTPYSLYDAELDYSNSFFCLASSGNYAITASNVYDCLSAKDTNITTSHTLDADIARIASAGPDGVFEGDNATDICSPATGSDDFVLCILR